MPVGPTSVYGYPQPQYQGANYSNVPVGPPPQYANLPVGAPPYALPQQVQFGQGAGVQYQRIPTYAPVPTAPPQQDMYPTAVPVANLAQPTHLSKYDEAQYSTVPTQAYGGYTADVVPFDISSLQEKL